jgi:lipopolysaccharide transport system ATP-binding protein
MKDPANAIELTSISKSFKIYHEKRTTLFEYLSSITGRKSNYETLRVLDNVSFEVKKGEMLGIIGKNGEGKTTLLRIISKIFKPDSGTVEVSGSMIPFLELGTGFQPELTARDNVILYGMLLGFSKKQIKEKLPEIMSYAELQKFADTKLKNFSSGMYARLAFSTAVQVDPDILLVDEVLAVGDVTFQEKSFDTFMSFRRRNKTIIFVSHSLDQIERLCDRAVFLHQGKVIMMGHPHDVVSEFHRVIERSVK